LGQIDCMFVRRLKIELGLWFLAHTGITTLVRTDIWAKQPSASQSKLLLQDREPGTEILEGKERLADPRLDGHDRTQKMCLVEQAHGLNGTWEHSKLPQFDYPNRFHEGAIQIEKRSTHLHSSNAKRDTTLLLLFGLETGNKPIQLLW
jgi:hypothetical protein